MKNLKLNAKFILIMLALISSISHVFAWTYTATGPWASFSFSDGWTVYQDAWGAPNDPSPVLYANSSSNWACYVNYTGGGVKNYAHVQKDADIPISSSYYCTASFNVSAPNNPWWNFMFDVWTANMQDELIISQTWNGDAIWGDIVATNVTIGGRLFKEVRQANNGYNNVIIFTPNEKRWSGTEDIMAFFIWSLNRGLLHNSTLHQVSFGVEVTYTSGWQQFTCNSFSCSWGQTSTSSYVKIQNKATGLFIDGMGRTSNGSNAGQWSNSSSYNQQWIMETSGNYVRFKNRATGLYIDGMHCSSNGSLFGQWGNSNSNNQQWTVENYGNYKRIKNRATGLYIDGMYWSSNGSDLGQWSSSGSDAQQWTIITQKSAESKEEEQTIKSDNIIIYPNPFTSVINLQIDKPEQIIGVAVFDMQGKQVEVIDREYVNRFMVLGSSLKTGMYVVKVFGLDNTRSFTIFKK